MLLYVKAAFVGSLFALVAFFATLVVVSRSIKPLIPPGSTSVSVAYWPLPTAAIAAFLVGFWWSLR